MEKRVLLNKTAVAGIVALLVLLVCVRLFQEQLFYDPFIDFFRKQNFKGQPLPQFSPFKLGLHLFFRYVLNALLSLGIIWLLFRDKSVIRLSVLLYLIFFIILIAAFYIIENGNEPDLLLLFYIRRFIIQPLFLLLFVPAFYYQNKAK